MGGRGVISDKMAKAGGSKGRDSWLRGQQETELPGGWCLLQWGKVLMPVAVWSQGGVEQVEWGGKGLVDWTLASLNDEGNCWGLSRGDISCPKF